MRAQFVRGKDSKKSLKVGLVKDFYIEMSINFDVKMDTQRENEKIVRRGVLFLQTYLKEKYGAESTSPESFEGYYGDTGFHTRMIYPPGNNDDSKDSIIDKLYREITVLDYNDPDYPYAISKKDGLI